VLVVLTRRGQVDLAVSLMLLSYAAALAGGVLAMGAVTTAPIFALGLVTLAGTLFRPAHVLPAYAGALLLVVALPALVDGRTLPVSWTEQVFVVAVTSVVTAVAAAVSSIGTRSALRQAHAERDRAERLADQLRRTNEGLETRVRQRTSQLQEMAVRDPLTGIHNRRHVDEALPRLVARAVREGTPLAMLAIDIDDFKGVNEQFGHGGGDIALQAVAAALRAVCRPDDLLSRVGGEEFVLLLPGTGLGDAVGIADRARRLVSAIDWAPPLVGLHLTVSVGVAALSVVTRAEALWQVADDRLFAAKRAGKDRVVAQDTGSTRIPAQADRASTATPAQASAHRTLVKVPMMKRSDVPGSRSSG